jgi:hypothetical protein
MQSCLPVKVIGTCSCYRKDVGLPRHTPSSSIQSPVGEHTVFPIKSQPAGETINRERDFLCCCAVCLKVVTENIVYQDTASMGTKRAGGSAVNGTHSR